MSKLGVRAAALSLLLALLCVPAVTRVRQTLEVSPSANPLIGFSTSGNMPPDPISIHPQIDLLDLVVRPITPDPVVNLPFVNELLPALPSVIDVGSLRAPPALLVS